MTSSPFVPSSTLPKRIFIFICNNKTEKGCLNSKKFALPQNKSNQQLVEEITMSDLCALYNLSTRQTLFPFKPTSLMHIDDSKTNGAAQCDETSQCGMD